VTEAVRHGNPEEARPLLEASHALMIELFPAESNHYLSIDDLKTPEIRFFVAEDDGKILGCGALAIKAGYGEVKSMFTHEAARGQGIADAVLGAILRAADEEDVPIVRLETGHLLEAAHRLYARHGFELRGPFGDYTEDPNSIFMEKVL